MNRRILIVAGCVVALSVLAILERSVAQSEESVIPVNVTVDVSKPGEPLKPIWRFFGADEPNYATMKDGRKLIALLVIE